MRRPRAFTCSRLRAEPLPPPTRKPLGYAALLEESSSSPCECGSCREPPSPSTIPTASALADGDAVTPHRSKAEALTTASPTAKPRFRRLPRAGLRGVASASTASVTAATKSRESSARMDRGEQRKRGSDRGDRLMSSATTRMLSSGDSNSSVPSVLSCRSAASSTASGITSATTAGAALYPLPPAATAAAAAAAAAVAAATPAAVRMDAGGEEKIETAAAASAAAAAAAMMFNPDILDETSVTFFRLHQQGRPTLDDLNLISNGSSSSSSSAGAKGLDKWKAPATAASGVFSLGAPSSHAAAAAFGRRRRRVGG
ncbi:unnamed protein product [Pylaiella littoralis]